VQLQDYVLALTAEMELKRRYIGRPRVNAIFVGGGTPSLLTASQISYLGDSIERNFELDTAVEFTFEIEVKSISPEKIRAMRQIGVNRVSFGAQTLLDEYRNLFSLTATKEQIFTAAELLNAAFSYTNVDLLYGMPGESFAQLHTDLTSVISLGTTTIDVYPINNLSAQRSMNQAVSRAGLNFLPATTRLLLRMYIDRILREHGYAPTSGYTYDRGQDGQIASAAVLQPSPKCLYFDIFYGYDSDEVIGYGSSALSQIPGFNFYNIPNRQAYMREVINDGALPHKAFGPVAAPERGIVTFPYRGILNKAAIAWDMVPEETLVALRESLDARLIVEGDEKYELTKEGWLFYVNLMYYYMPNFGKSWISEKIAHQQEISCNYESTELLSLIGGEHGAFFSSALNSPTLTPSEGRPGGQDDETIKERML